MVTCDTLASGHTVKATSAQPDAAGWCSYGARLAPSPSALCLYIQNKLTSDERALVDSAVLGPDDGTVLPQAAEFFVPLGWKLMRCVPPSRLRSPSAMPRMMALCGGSGHLDSWWRPARGHRHASRPTSPPSISLTC